MLLYYTTQSGNYVPEGYKLVEKPEHKKKRLVKELSILQDNEEYWQNLLVETGKKLKEVKEKLKELED